MLKRNFRREKKKRKPRTKIINQYLPEEQEVKGNSTCTPFEGQHHFSGLKLFNFMKADPFRFPVCLQQKKKIRSDSFLPIPFPYRESLKITRNKNRRLLPHFDQKHLQPRNKISSRIKSYLLNCKRMLFNASRNYQLWPFSPWKWRKARSVQGISFPIMNIALRFHEPDRKACFIYEN